MTSVETNGDPALNLGIIGLGGGASQMIPAFLKHPHINLMAAADIDQVQLDRFRSELHGDTCRSAEAETAMKRDRRFGGGGRTAQGTVPGQRRSTPWILGGPLVVSFDKGDVRLTPDGLLVYGDEVKQEVSLVSDRDGRDGVIDQVYQAVVHGKRPANDGEWGMATLEVLLALFQSGQERKEIFLCHQMATID